MRVDVRANGTATWRVEYHFQLTADGERESFRSLRDDIERNPSNYTAQFADRIRPSVTAAERETGREMAVGNVSVAVRRQRLAQPTGIITYRFTWRRFARSNGSAIHVGDAIRGFYVGPTTTLTLTWPDQYRAARTLPSPDAERTHRLSWQGELGFGADEPQVLVTTAEAATATQSAPGGGSGDATPGGVSPVLIAVGGLLLAVLGTGGAVAARNRGSPDATDEPAAETAPASSVPDEELLSDEERALAVVAERGGRVKQQALVDACDWTDSKASRVVSDLRENGDVEVFRLGRENVISLPEETDEN